MLHVLKRQKNYNTEEQNYERLEHGGKHKSPNNSKCKELKDLFLKYVMRNRDTNGRTKGNCHW